MATTSVTAPATATVTVPRRRSALGRHAMTWAVGVVVAAFVLIPLTYALLGGFKTNGELVGSANPIPSTWVFSNYQELLVAPFFWRELLNSVIVAGITVALVGGVCSPAGFSFSRGVFPGRAAFFTPFSGRPPFPPGGRG